MLLYFAGTMIIYEPSEECITDFWRNGIVKKLPVSSSNPTFVKAASQLRDSCEDINFCGSILHDDYIKLFLMKESSFAPAFESVYNRNAHTKSDPQSLTVTEFYNSYGWISKFKGKIKDDHLAIELLFLTRLIEKYLEIEDDACQGEMSNEIRRFINLHLFSWISEWNKRVQLHSNTLCFKSIGTLILACVEDIYSLFEKDFPTIFSLENLKN
jgi:TorA maturation chaperone TorD